MISSSMTPARIIGLGLLAIAGYGLHLGAARAVASKTADLGDPIQVLADLTVIDDDCRDLAVDFGIGFRYAADQGLPAASILPTGRRRSAFETALRQTQSTLDDTVVCGALAHHYSVALPGSVTFPPSPRSGS